MMLTAHPKKAIKLLKLTGLLQFVIPEMVPAIKMTQNKYHSDKVFDHILKVLSGTDPVLVQRLMALFHDIGKTVTRTVDNKTGGVHFYGHELEGEKMVEDIMMRLKYPRALIDQVKLGVRNHMRLKQAGTHGNQIKDATLIRFRNDMGETLPHLLKVIHADNLAHADPEALRHQIAGVEKRLETLKDIPPKPQLPITGNDLQSELGLKPGPIFRDIMKAINNAWVAREIQNKKLPPEKKRSLSREEALAIAKHMAGI
jgi:putative nucleotidyltransferase with HDIG domain